MVDFSDAGICPNRAQASPHQPPTNSARISERSHGSRMGGIPKAGARYKIEMSGANAAQMRDGCGADGSKCQFVSRQAEKSSKVSVSSGNQIYVYLTILNVVGVSRGGRASAEPVRCRAAKLSQTEHFSAARWVGAGAGQLRLS